MPPRFRVGPASPDAALLIGAGCVGPDLGRHPDGGSSWCLTSWTASGDVLGNQNRPPG